MMANKKYLLLIVLLFLSGGCSSNELVEEDALAARKAMVMVQIKQRGISDPKTLEALMTVERHRFVPDRLQNQAYDDKPLPIGEGQTISQPYIVAYMTEALSLVRTDKVLEIGTGSGYQAAILGELSDHVYTIEIIESLGLRAGALLQSLGYENIRVKVGDGYQGWVEHAPFDVIIVTCAPRHVPKPLQQQLQEGGRMIIPVGKPYQQKLVILRKLNGKLVQDDVLAVRFVPMVNDAGSTY